MTFRFNQARVVHLFIVVVFAGDPEDRHRLNALLAQTVGELDDGHRLVNRVERAGEQAGLLSCNDGYRTGTAQHLDVLESQFGRAGATVDAFERVSDAVAVIRPRADLTRVLRKRRRRAPAVGVEARYFLVIVKKIVEEAGRARNLREAERVRGSFGGGFEIGTVAHNQWSAVSGQWSVIGRNVFFQPATGHWQRATASTPFPGSVRCRASRC